LSLCDFESSRHNRLLGQHATFYLFVQLTLKSEAYL